MRIGIVGSDTLLGRELKEQVEERGMGAKVELLSSGEQILTEQDDEPVVLGALTRESMEGLDAVLLAGGTESSRRALALAGAETAVVDMTGALEEEPEARLVGRSDARALRVVAHPAAIVVARVLETVAAAAPVRHSVVLVFEPASERGQAGITELQQQTTGLLSFRQLDKAVFDAQIGFNMLARYGSDAPVQLDTIEQRIDRHLATLLGNSAPLPSLRLVQSPVFHGHSFSFWIEFEGAADAAEIEAAMVRAGFDVRDAEVEAPSNVGVAGQSGISVGVIERDRNHPKALWMWAAADNYRIVADAALDAIGELTGS